MLDSAISSMSLLTPRCLCCHCYHCHSGGAVPDSYCVVSPCRATTWSSRCRRRAPPPPTSRSPRSVPASTPRPPIRTHLNRAPPARPYPLLATALRPQRLPVRCMCVLHACDPPPMYSSSTPRDVHISIVTSSSYGVLWLFYGCFLRHQHVRLSGYARYPSSYV